MNWFRKLAILSGLLVCAIAGAVEAEAADLVVTVRQVRSAQGIIAISVFDSANTFLGYHREVIARDVVANEGEMPIVFKDLPPGKYAVAAYHDENNSGDLDTNFLGIPTEGFGFSNGAKAFLGPPEFDAAAVPLETKTETKVELRY